VPGQSVACVGPGACGGGQVCEPSGAAFGPCVCAVPAADSAGDAAAGSQPDVGVPGFFVLSWSLVSAGSTTPVTCAEAGTPMVAITSTDRSTGEEFVDQFPCGPNTAVQARRLQAGSYQVRVALLSKDGSEMAKKEDTFELRAGSTTDLGEIVLAVQRFQVTWTLRQGGRTVTCQEANASKVVLLTQRDGKFRNFEFLCAEGRGATTAIETGAYSIDVRLFGNQGEFLWKNAQPIALVVTTMSRPPFRT
jgi:hypothetical protein